jgi:hypothetical protein
MVIESCGACRFWAELKPGDKVTFGICRRRAPTPILLGHRPAQMVGQAPQAVIQGFFPETPSHGWCGDYQQPAPRMDLKRLDIAALETEGVA